MWDQQTKGERFHEAHLCFNMAEKPGRSFAYAPMPTSSSGSIGMDCVETSVGLQRGRHETKRGPAMPGLHVYRLACGNRMRILRCQRSMDWHTLTDREAASHCHA